MQFARKPHHLLDLLHRGHAFALAAPEVVFDAHAHVQAHGDRHRIQRQHAAHDAFDRQDCAVRDPADELHHVVGVRPVHAAADRRPVHRQRAGVDAAPDQALDGLELPHVAEHEERLDAVGLQPAQVFLDEAGPRGNGHLAVGLLIGRIRKGRVRDIVCGQQLADVHLVGVDRDRHLVRLRRELREHVARVVAEPLGRLAVGLGRERNRAADLQDHVGNRIAQAGKQFVEHRHALGALAVRLAHMDVQERCAGVVAVDRLLDLLVHRHRDVAGVGGNPFGAVRRDLDDQGLLVFGKEGVVEELHGCLRVAIDEVRTRVWLCRRSDD